MAKARELNEVIRYVMYAVFRVRRPVGDERDAVAAEVETLLEQLADKGVVTRGV